MRRNGLVHVMGFVELNRYFLLAIALLYNGENGKA
jgi:hypothetical protein